MSVILLLQQIYSKGEVIGDHFPSHNSDYFLISFNVSEPLPVVIRQKYMPAVQVEASRYL
jgi:hypothetical protein